jgi:tetratricopeptide (TPR) repeat protein
VRVGRLEIVAALAVTFCVPAGTRAVAAAPVRVHTVQRIEVDGKVVPSTGGVTMTLGGSVEQTAREGETILDGTRVDVVQAGVVLTIESTGEISVATLVPGSSVTFNSTGRGELVTSNAGKTTFSIVPKMLDFFRVQSGNAINAAVHGTVFSVDTAASGVTFDCTRGVVNITKNGYLWIGQGRVKATLIDVIAAASRPAVTYHPTSVWYFARFANFAQAETYYRQQVVAAEVTGDANAVNAARMNLGNVLEHEGRYDDALRAYRAALAYYAGNDRARWADAVDDIGIVEEEQGKHEDAARSHAQAVATYRELGDRDGEAGALENAGNVQAGREDYAAALKSYQQARSLYQQLGDGDGEASALNNIAVVQEDRHANADALQSLQAALPLYRLAGDRDGEAGALTNLGDLRDEASDFADALQSLQKARAIYVDLGDGAGEAAALDGIGIVLEDEKRSDDALKSHRQALAIFQTLGDQKGQARAYYNIGIALESENYYEDALVAFQKSAALHGALGERDAQARALGQLGLAQEEQRDYAGAMTSLQQALKLFQDVNDRDGEAAARKAIDELRSHL